MKKLILKHKMLSEGQHLDLDIGQIFSAYRQHLDLDWPNILSLQIMGLTRHSQLVSLDIMGLAKHSQLTGYRRPRLHKLSIFERNRPVTLSQVLNVALQ